MPWDQHRGCLGHAVPVPDVRRLIHGLAAAAMLSLVAPASWAQAQGLVTEPSRHDVRATLDRFEAAVRAAGWVVFAEVDHSAEAKDMGLSLPPRTVVLFGNPRAGTSAMHAHPTLAIDLPMRVLVWQDDQGRVFITRNTGADIATRVFARHGITIPTAGQEETDRFIATLVRKAAE